MFNAPVNKEKSILTVFLEQSNWEFTIPSKEIFQQG